MNKEQDEAYLVDHSDRGIRLAEVDTEDGRGRPATEHVSRHSHRHHILSW